MAVVVFTNGCFDILHAGHIRCLQWARSQGDRLVVGLNSDASIRRLKGPGRPVNHENDRLEVLAALRCVDEVHLFDEDTPYELVKRVRPEILVKGEDYRDKVVVGADLVKEVRFAPIFAGRSTTNAISRIVALD
jgi:D-beta-D-heptose 7-phosphate kinase/D-beta-D-heptose 1-phosphate adenosyltransferase